MENNRQPRIGMLWGDFPWTSAPKKLGKLWSMGRVARDVTRAISSNMEIVPYQPPENNNDEREAMASFLKKIDILWADIYPHSAFALNLRDELGVDIPAILFAGGALPKGAEAMLFPWQHILRSDDALLFTCQADQDIWSRLVAWSNLKQWVIPLSVDETVFYPRCMDEREETRKKYSVPSDALILLYVGRLNIQKNIHTLLYMFKAVNDQISNSYLCIVGEEDDISLGEFRVRNTGYLEWLCSIANNLGITEKVKFVGPLFGEDLARMYSAANVVVNFGFYHRENFGLSQAEAAACGVPVVCTSWGGFKDVVQDGQTGYFVDAVLTKNGIRVDWAHGANQVIKLLQQRSLREEMGRKATAYSLQHFSIAALTRNLTKMVNEVLLRKDNTNRMSSLAYKPSEFAERYEVHKRSSGWNAPSIKPPQWYPPMFQGREYELYEILMEPYSTYLAEKWEMDFIHPEQVPYFPSPVVLDSTRLLISNEDPIWAHRRFLLREEWEVLKYVDGSRTLKEIAELSGNDLSVCITILWVTYVEGFILFTKAI
ncbi:glycosyltransferase family 4 protein [Paenibacillus alkalitolerans]|uniref:glycosyltransferase family 4 protein n=1 Tax=Paenibacillus alkalitolerans TaxID=2799335 RepID=UPI0018F418AC|nr:glycosyltransferase family 4 protein [Paenibacillus alkalitolerans]